MSKIGNQSYRKVSSISLMKYHQKLLLVDPMSQKVYESGIRALTAFQKHPHRSVETVLRFTLRLPPQPRGQVL